MPPLVAVKHFFEAQGKQKGIGTLKAFGLSPGR